MSSKKKHGKTKILTRKDKKMLVSNIVKAANNVANPFSSYVEYQNYTQQGLDLCISYVPSLAAEENLKDSVWHLLKTNMQEMYEKSSWGWDEEQKMSELTDKDAHFLLAKDPDGRLVAFSHFRFVVDFGYPVLYCYELQLHQDVRRKGLGQYLMRLLFLMALDLKLIKIVLTVFKSNQPAMDFYMKTLSFKLDETSPALNSSQCYVILSKYVDKKSCVFV